jgi:hypothetical protein
LESLKDSLEYAGAIYHVMSRGLQLAKELRRRMTMTMTMAWIAEELNAGLPQTLWRVLWASSKKSDKTRD